MFTKSAHAGVALGDQEPAARLRKPESPLDDRRSAYLRSASRVDEPEPASAAPGPLQHPPARSGGYLHRIINLVMLISGNQIKRGSPAGVCGRRRKTMGWARWTGRLGPAFENTLRIHPDRRRRGRIVRVSHRMVKTRSRVTSAASTLRIRLVSEENSSLKCEKEKQSCTDL